jgi:N6-adenosine-specific RNA methylase IME4
MLDFFSGSGRQAGYASGSGAQARYAEQPDLLPAASARQPWPFAGLERWGYDLIMADPPWRFELYSERGEGKSAQAHYGTMSMQEIADLPVRDLGRPDCLLWLWATWPLLADQMRIVEAWGFRYVTGGTWVKRTVNNKLAFGTGYRLRSACEPFLIGVSGSPETARDVRNVVEGIAREHSRKPVEAYVAAERLMMGEHTHESFRAEHGRRCGLVEVFSRESRPGWDAWGNEAGKFNQEAG